MKLQLKFWKVQARAMSVCELKGQTRHFKKILPRKRSYALADFTVWTAHSSQNRLQQSKWGYWSEPVQKLHTVEQTFLKKR